MKTAMEEAPTETFEAAYREAYELAKKGNPVVQTMIARARFESGIATVSDDEAFRLAGEAASKGFPAAILFEGLLHHLLQQDADESGCYEWVAEAADKGWKEARYLRAFADFAQHRIDWEDLLHEFSEASDDGRCLMGAATMIAGRALRELAEAHEEARASAKQARLLDRRVAALKDAGIRRRKDDRSRIGGLEGERKSLMKSVALLSASSLATERDGLQSELAAVGHRLADAERQASEARCDLEAKIAGAVSDMKDQAEQAQLERDIAVEDRDEAMRRVEKAERKARLMDGVLRKHGLGLAEAFGDEEQPAVAGA